MTPQKKRFQSPFYAEGDDENAVTFTGKYADLIPKRNGQSRMDIRQLQARGCRRSHYRRGRITEWFHRTGYRSTYLWKL